MKLPKCPSKGRQPTGDEKTNKNYQKVRYHKLHPNASYIKRLENQKCLCNKVYRPTRGIQKTCSKKCGYKLVANSKIGKKNPMWKGNKVSYSELHHWVYRWLKKPKRCQKCGKIKQLNAANISQKYKRKITDWVWLCVKCHMKQDGRTKHEFCTIKDCGGKHEAKGLCRKHYKKMRKLCLK